ncbi:MAG: tetratricopeptide repeat protein [Bacteroidota bacterium]
MKIKPIYIYGIIVVAIVIVLVISNSSKVETESNISTNPQTEMPQDDIHKGLKGEGDAGPSKGNVKSEFWERLDKLEKEIEADPNDTLKMRQYAELLSMAHQTDKALGYYQKILNVDPKRIDILLSEGLVYFNEGKYDEAEKVTNRILEINKNHHEAKFNLGVIAASQGDKDKAKKIWTELVESNPETEAAKYAKEALTKL